METILCPVDFTTVTEDALRIAVQLCRQSGARLVLHHNLGPAPPDFLGVHWMWDEEHGPASERQETTVVDEFGDLFATLPDEIEYEAKVSRGPLEDGVLFLARQLPADLVVLGHHGRASAEHRSLTEQIILRAPCSVLATSDDGAPATLEPAADRDRRRPIVVATDLSGHDAGAVALAFDLAAALDEEVHLLHVLKPPRRESDDKRREVERRTRDRLTALVPEELAARSHCHLRRGSAASEILAAATELDARCLLLGARKHGLLYRAFKGLTSLEVLRQARWPVWFVPGDRVPAGLKPIKRQAGGNMDWEQAREQTVAQWRSIRAGLGRELPVDLVAEVNAVSELCVKAREAADEPAHRCDFCIAYGDVGGCARVRLQITEALLDEDWDRAGRYIDEVVELLREAQTPPSPAASAG